MKTVLLKDYENIEKIVDIHLKTFQGFFLTFLGRGFLKQLYKGFIDHENSETIACFKGEELVGFLAFSYDISAFYKYLIKKKLIFFAYYSMLAFFRKPKVLFRLLRAFTYSDGSKREEKYIELSSIGVSPEYKNLGIGSILIDELKSFALSAKSNAEYIKLETDAEDNDGANAFYLKNKFVLNNAYTTREGRKMNEYRFYLK